MDHVLAVRGYRPTSKSAAQLHKAAAEAMVDARDGDAGGGPAVDERPQPSPSATSGPQGPFLRRCSSGLLDSLRRMSVEQVSLQGERLVVP